MADQPDVIENYLDRVCRQLLMLPDDDVAQIRCEMREHLRISVEELIATGTAPEAAAGEAIRKFGRAKHVGRQFALKSPYSWMWRLIEGELMMSIVSPKIFAIGFLSAALLMVVGSLLEFLHITVRLPIWVAVLYGVVFLVQGYLNGISAIIRQAGNRDFNGVSRKVAIAVELFDSTNLPRWKRGLNLHRLLPALRIALPLVDRPRLSPVWWMFAVNGILQPFAWSEHGYVAKPYHSYSVLFGAMFLGLAIGEAICIAYYRNRPRLTSAQGMRSDA